MNMEWLVAAGILLLLVTGDLGRQYTTRKRRLIRSIREGWGKKPDNAFDARDMEGFSLLFKVLAGKASHPVIDDITWNDLEMDKLYTAMNSTATTFGDETLYAVLRMPLYDKTSHERRAAFIRYWEEHPESREKVLLILRRFGKFSGRSPSVMLGDSTALDLKDRFWYKILSFMPLMAALLLFVNVGVGFLLTALVIGMNALYHERVSKEMESRLAALSTLSSSVALANRLAGLLLPGLTHEQTKLAQLYKVLRPVIQKASPYRFIDTSSGTSDFSVLFKIVFLSDIWGYQSALSFAREKRDELCDLIRALGEWDVAICVASWRKSLGTWCVPQIQWEGQPREGAVLNASQVVHPLIEECVPNPVCIARPVLLTGSNASGKSTYLKTVAINALLAHTIQTCHASSWEGELVFPITSMALRDNMQNGESYFMAEIKSLKRIFDVARGKVRCLCIVDEVLRGTNTLERIAASSTLLMALSRLNTCVVAATHDVELTRILEGRFENRHFEESVTDRDVVFDYRLKDGKATSRNAIKLLGLMGFSPEVIQEAYTHVEAFEEDGQWKAFQV